MIAVYYIRLIQGGIIYQCNIDVAGWTLVREVTTANVNWHTASDHAVGTQSYGIQGVSSAWSIAFSAMTWD